MEEPSNRPSPGKNHTPSQTYLSSRGGDYDLSFETVVMKGLAGDGGLFLPTEIPVANNWTDWKHLSYTELAFQILSLYISDEEIPAADLRSIIDRSYSTFRAKEITPLVHLRDNLYLAELFHGPSYSFKDCALQFLGNLFEYFLVRKNEGKKGEDRYHLTVVGATSGDTGSAAIHGLRGKSDLSVFILHPKGRISPCQENQMTTVLDDNVHNMAIEGTFDDCQNIVKSLFSDPDTNETIRLGAVNSINWSRILAQIVYYFRSYFLLAQKSSFNVGEKVKIVVPTGNFGNVLAGYLAAKMGLPIEKLVVATNENDILYRFWETGRYEKKPASDESESNNPKTNGVNVHEDGCKETLSVAMDILVSSNFERLMWFLVKDHASSNGHDIEASRKQAGEQVSTWFQSLKTTGGFGPVNPSILHAGRQLFESDRVSDPQTLSTIKAYYRQTSYVLDPHTAVGVTAADRSIARTRDPSSSQSQQQEQQTTTPLPHISMSTAHPAKFSYAVELALKDEEGFDFEKSVLPEELDRLARMEKRVRTVENSFERVREIVKEQVVEDRRKKDG